jgi:hypothetical protein
MFVLYLKKSVRRKRPVQFVSIRSPGVSSLLGRLLPKSCLHCPRKEEEEAICTYAARLMFTRIVGSAAPVRCHVCQPDPFRSERRRRRVPVGRVHAHGSTAPSSSRAEPAANAAGPVRISAGQAYPRCSASSAESPNTVPAHEIAVGQRGVRKWMAVSVPRFKCVRQGMYDRLTSLSFCRGIGTAK